MNTQATLIHSEDGNFHVYIELLDGTVHLSVDRDGVRVDIVLMDIDEWTRLGLPNRYIGRLGEREK